MPVCVPTDFVCTYLFFDGISLPKLNENLLSVNGILYGDLPSALSMFLKQSMSLF